MKTLYPWKLYLQRIAVLLLTYQALRAIFVLGNLALTSGMSSIDVGLGFFYGFRFDIWVALWLNFPLLLLTFLPWSWQAKRWFQNAVLAYVMVISFFVVGINLIDTELFKFTGKRITVEWLRLQQDMKQQTGSLIAYYWWLLVLGLIFLALQKRYWPEWSAPAKASGGSVRRFVAGVVILAVSILGLRGGWQLKPLNLAHAYAMGSPSVASVAMNSPFSFLRSRDQSYDSLKVRFFQGREAERDAILEAMNSGPSTYHGQFRDYNVVLIIVESLAAEYVGFLNQGEGYTPFLDELAKKSFSFENNFANGRRSIEAVPSLVCGLPSLMAEALILSPYQGVELHCLPHLASRFHYDSYFFHGAYNGSMYFDSFSSRAGFSHFMGYSEFNDPRGDDGHWGAFDDPFLQFMALRLTEAKAPFFATVFTLSSHNPYRIPDGLKFPVGELEIHPSIGYVDHALKNFFATAEKQPWFDKTIFFITGDHTQKSVNPRYQTWTGEYRVPMLVYIPGVELKGNAQKITQHSDVVPTIIDLLGWDEAPRLRIGQSFFSSGPGVAFNGQGYAYWLLTDQQLVEYDIGRNAFKVGTYEFTTWRSQWESDLKPENKRAQEALESVLDYFNWGVLGNRLYKK